MYNITACYSIPIGNEDSSFHCYIRNLNLEPIMS